MSVCRIIWFLVLLLNIPSLRGQTIHENISTSKLKSYGERAFQVRDYFMAIDYLQEYSSRRPDDVSANLLLAKAYDEARDYNSAKLLYLGVYQSNKKRHVEALYHFALMEKNLGNYQSSIEHFKRFEKESTKISPQLKSELNLHLTGSLLAINMVNAEDALMKANIERLGPSINKPFSEASPLYLDNTTIIYSSLKLDTMPIYEPDENTDKRQFFMAEKHGGIWFGGIYWPGNINNREFHTGNGTLSKDGQRFYFNRGERDDKGKFICKIFYSEKQTEGWSVPLELPEEINKKLFTATQPLVVEKSSEENLEILYFVSDRPAGFGGMDIWYTVHNYKTGVYSPVKNAGAVINTSKDEVTPYFSDLENRFYFSSNGWPSFGGFDVFSSQGSEQNWTPPKNGGHPLNSSFDELFYTQDPTNAQEGMFVSNRSGTESVVAPNCCDDIYQFDWLDHMKIDVIGKVYDASYIEKMLEMDDVEKMEMSASMQDNNYLVKNQKVMLYELAGMNQYIPKDSAITDDNGEYRFKLDRDHLYKIIIERPGFFNKHHEFATKNVPDPLRQHLGLSVITKDPVVVKNIYYAYDKYELDDKAKSRVDTTLLKIMDENPNLILEILSHTDNRGSLDYNIKLSQKRAEKVVAYLVDRGVSAKRLKATGYGETRPIAPNNYSDGSDNPDGRARNRRTEFKVIGRIAENEILYKR